MPIEPPQVRMPMMGASFLILMASENISPLEPVSSLIRTTHGPTKARSGSRQTLPSRGWVMPQISRSRRSMIMSPVKPPPL